METKKSQQRFTEEFKTEAVRQVTERGHPVAEVAARLGVSSHSLYAWIKRYGVPPTQRAQQDSQSEESGRVYGYRKVCNDLRDLGERCGKHRVARLMRQAGWKSQTGYTRRPGFRSGKPAVVAPNHLKRAFDVAEPNKVWVTDITYIRTHEGWLYLSVVLDLFSRQIVGWSMGERMTRDLAISALLMAVSRRKPVQEVLVHSDQGSQFSSHDWQDFLKAHRLKPSMSRRGNCHDNAVVESFFQLLKRERIVSTRPTHLDREPQGVVASARFHRCGNSSPIRLCG